MEPRLGLALDISPVAMLLLEPRRDAHGRLADFTCAYVNSRAARILGGEPADLEGRSVRELLPDVREAPALLQACGEVLESGGRRQIELEWSAANSGVFSISVAATGECVSLWLTDVSEYRRAVSEAVASRAELESITGLMPAGVSHCTRDLRYAWANPRFGEWIGRSPKELVGLSIRDVVGPAAFAALEPYFKRVLAGERVEYEEEIEYTGLGRRWVHALRPHPRPTRCRRWVGGGRSRCDRQEAPRARARAGARGTERAHFPAVARTHTAGGTGGNPERGDRAARGG